MKNQLALEVIGNRMLEYNTPSNTLHAFKQLENASNYWEALGIFNKLDNGMKYLMMFEYLTSPDFTSKPHVIRILEDAISCHID